MRLMIIGVTGVAVALTAGSIALYGVLGIAVNRTLDNEARASAADVAALIDRGTPPDPLPISGVQVVQIVDAGHRVVGGSVNADRLTPLLHPDELQRALTGVPIVVSGNRAGLSGPLRVTAQAAGPGSAPVSVVVAVQVADVTRSLDVLRTALWISAPALLAVIAVIAWYVIGWTLRPVETLRQGAERISGSDQAERLPVPESADEIAALAVTLNQMLDRLTAARGRQRAFVADAAHELRSPLASIRVQLEVAQRVGDGTDSTAELLLDVDRLSVLVEDLLLLARADADTRGPAAPTTFEIGALLDETSRAKTAARMPVTAEPGPPVTVVADRDEIRRAIGNLVDNAVRHARTGVRLSAIAGPDRTALVHVIDDGPGIAEADRERVFDRFTRLDDARDRDAGGSGLGLPIVRELARRARGTVTLGSGPSGSGLDAVLVLPAGETPRNGDLPADAGTGGTGGTVRRSPAP